MRINEHEGLWIGQTRKYLATALREESKRETITLEEPKTIADTLDVKFEQFFILPVGNEMKAGSD